MGYDSRPYLIADAAFGLSSTVQKCFDSDRLTPPQKSFNNSVIRSRRVVEQAFGCFKGRWKVCSASLVNDPKFAAKVANVCCGLHNICECLNCPYEDSVLPDPLTFQQQPEEVEGDDSIAVRLGRDVKNILAEWIHNFYSHV